MSSSPHIGLIAQSAAGWMGGATDIRNVQKAVLAANPAASVSVVCQPALAGEWEKDAPLVLVPPGRTKGWRGWFQPKPVPLSRVLDAAGIDFLYPLNYENRKTLGVEFPLAGRLGRCRWAGWVPDFQHRHLPEFFSPEECRYRDRQIAALARDARDLVLSSHDARADFERFVPGFDGRTHVLRFASAPDPGWYEPMELPAELECPERFFLISNQFWKHKNHLLVFEALARLKRRGVRPVVLCTGKLGDYRDNTYAQAVHQTLRDNGLETQVRILGLVPRRVQIELMRRALAVIQPSLFEGWSTVLEDARVLGRPCVVSDLGVHREQALPHAHYFRRTDPEDLAEKLASAWATFSPGPNRAWESAAREAAERAVTEFGRQFLGLAGGGAGEPSV